MAASDNIEVRIALSGATEIIGQLTAMGAAGESALAQIHAASAGPGLTAAAGEIDTVSGALRRMTSLFDEFERGQRGSMFATLGAALKDGASGFEGLIAGVAAASGALLLFGEQAATATRETENQAATLGLSTEKFEALRLTAEVAGVSQDKFTGLMDRFAASVGRARGTTDALAQATQAAAQSSAAALGRLAISSEEAALASDKLGTSRREEALTMKAADQSVDNATHSLKDLKQEFAAMQPPDPEKLGGAAFDAAQRNYDNFARRVKEAGDAVDTANERAQIAREKAAEAEKQAAIDRDKRAAQQQADLLKSQEGVQKLQTTEERAQATAAKFLEQASHGFQLGTLDTLANFADEFNAIPTAAEKAAVGTAAFGRGWAEIEPLLRKGSAGIRDLMGSLGAFTVTPTGGELDMAANFIAASAKLQAVAEGLKTALGNIFGQLWTPALNATAEFLKNNIASIREWAQQTETFLHDMGAQFAALLGPSFRAVGATIKGVVDDIGLALRTLQALFGSTAGGAFGTVAFAGLLSVLLRFQPTLLAITIGATALNEAMQALFGVGGLNPGTIAAAYLGYLGIARVFRDIATLTQLFTLERLLGGLGAASNAVGALSRGFLAFVSLFSVTSMLSGLQALSTAFVSLIAVLNRARLALLAIDIAAWANPAGFAILAFAVFVGGVVLTITRHWDGLKASLSDLGDWLKTTWVGKWADAVAPIFTWIGKLLDKIGEVAKALNSLFGSGDTSKLNKLLGIPDQAPASGASSGAATATAVPQVNLTVPLTVPVKVPVNVQVSAALDGSGDPRSVTVGSATVGMVDYPGVVYGTGYDAGSSGTPGPTQADIGGNAAPNQYAIGGMVHGPGTGTSDSIHALLSAGEFIVNAKSTSAFLPVLHAINRLSDPATAFAKHFAAGGLAQLLNPIRNFSMGGLVERMDAIMSPVMPSYAFAGGGMVPDVGATGGGSALRPIHLNIGGTTIVTHATEAAADQLLRVSFREQATSTGRKPGWSAR